MIKVLKSALPKELAKQLNALAKAYDTADEETRVKLRKKYSIVKAHLVRDFNGKCAYCESDLLHISAGQTDHVLPVSKKPKLLFAWSNLVLACENCNRTKNAYHNDSLPLVNPLVDNPAAHLTFIGSIIQDIDTRGYTTITELELDRGPLTAKRTERLMLLEPFVKWLERETDTDERTMIVNQFKQYAEPTREFSAMVALYVNDQLSRLAIS